VQEQRRPSDELTARTAAAPSLAEGVQRIVMGEIDDTARQLLREMGDQAEGKPTSDVLPTEAAENLGLDLGAPEYEAALNHLLALGDIKPASDPALVGQGLYRLTRQGLGRARELRWWR
jgi:hypothetical protein